MKKKYNTPHRCHVVKTRMTEEEYADFTERLKHYDMSQAEFIRQAITRATICPIVTVSPVNDELLSAVGRLTAEYTFTRNLCGTIRRSRSPPAIPFPGCGRNSVSSNSTPKLHGRPDKPPHRVQPLPQKMVSG